MTSSLEVESKLTDRYQTTVPESIRRALNLSKRDKLHYTLRSNGEVLLSRANTAEEDDPVLGRFLSFLSGDMDSNPTRLSAVGSNLQSRIQNLVEDSQVDLDEPLSAEDE
jgi:antitoxin PrlF